MRAAAEVAKGEAMEHQSGFEGFLFDMDGTLLHTLPDLVVVTNKALELEGFPPHAESEILRFVGNGVMSLVLQAVPAEATEEQAQRVFDHFTSLYSERKTSNKIPLYRFYLNKQAVYKREYNLCKSLSTDRNNIPVQTSTGSIKE